MADAFVDQGGLRITLSIAPRPPVAFKKIRVRVRAEALAEGEGRRAGSDRLAPPASRLLNARISFEMTMPMGEHRYVLGPGADGWQEADVVLPMCGSGDRRWYAIVEGSGAAGRPVSARFRLDLM